MFQFLQKHKEKQATSAASASSTSPGSHVFGMSNALATPSPLRLGYLYSAPLVHKAGVQAMELDMQEGMHIDVGQELGRLKRTLQDARRAIMFRAEVATVKNCRKLLTIGCRMLHYTGIGKPSCLIFEKEKPVGETNVLSIGTLTELFAAGGVRTQLVFVSACHSEMVARAFIAAGVRHVVAMKWDAKSCDRAACIFSESFYLSIALGSTVRQAFEVATTAALTETGLENDEQFLLLPAEGDHDLAIFEDAEQGDLVDESPPPIPNTCDPPPVPLVGRNVAVQEVVSLLTMVSQGNRCITIRGQPGLGKTAVASQVCKYLAERNHFDAIYLVPLQRKDYRSYEKETLCKVLGSAIGFDDASNEREIVFLLQDKHPLGRVIMVLDGPDRFFGRSNCLVQVLSYLLTRIHGLHLLITAEGSMLSNGSGRLEGSSEKVVQLGPLSDVATAHMLVNIAPPGFRLEEMMSRPYATRDEAYAELGDSPVVRELHGHPKAIVKFAPLLEDHRLEDLLEKAKQCYIEASQAPLSEMPSVGEEGGVAGAVLDGSKEAQWKELDATCLERETEEARKYLRDASCQKLWLDVVRQGGARQLSGMQQGIPWYRLTDALQEELRKILVDALRLLRPKITPMTPSSPEQQGQSNGEEQGSTLEEENAQGSERPTAAGPSESDVIRGLEPDDIQFIKDKMGAKPENDLVKITEFAVFCEGWVSAQNSIRLLCREWLCNEPPLLHGFLTRKKTEELLKDKKEGTFLFRFSTSHLGLLSLSFVGKGSRTNDTPTQIRHFLVQVEDDGKCVVFMEPGRTRHASLRELAMHSASLTEFYPGVPKAKALKQLARLE